MVNNYHETYEIQDKKEWSAVTTELKAFSLSNCVIMIVGDDGKPVHPTYRCTQVNYFSSFDQNCICTIKLWYPFCQLLDAHKTVMSNNLQLREAVVIGNCTGQVRASHIPW